jgi:hypothetical protein
MGTVSETAGRHNQKNCIVSAEETVTTHERRWNIGIYPDIGLYRPKNVSEDKPDSKQELLL